MAPRCRPKGWLLIAAAAVPALAAGPALGRPRIDHPFALLQGLDKVMAAVSPIVVPVGQSADFGTLRITVRACRSTPPGEPADNAAFLQIADRPVQGGPARPVFSGWMFSASPSLSALDHPVYDIWLAGCADVAPEADAAVAGGRHTLPDDPPLPPPLPPQRRGAADQPASRSSSAP